MKRIYKGMWLTMLFIVIGMATMIVVKADDTSVLCNNPQDMRICLGVTPMEMTPPADWSYCSRYDFNYDEKINLADVGYLAKMCYEEPQEEVKPEPVFEKKKSSSSVFIKKEADGSLTFRSRGTAVQYPNNNMIIKWNKKTVGTYKWDWKGNNYVGTFYDCYGYECVNVKEA